MTYHNMFLFRRIVFMLMVCMGVDAFPDDSNTTTADECFQTYLNKSGNEDIPCKEVLTFIQCAARERGYFIKTLIDNDIHESEYHLRQNVNQSCYVDLLSVINAFNFDLNNTSDDRLGDLNQTLSIQQATTARGGDNNTRAGGECFQVFLKKSRQEDMTCEEVLSFAMCVARQRGHFNKTLTGNDIQENVFHLRQVLNQSKSTCYSDLLSVINASHPDQRNVSGDQLGDLSQALTIPHTAAGYAVTEEVLGENATTWSVTEKSTILPTTRSTSTERRTEILAAGTPPARLDTERLPEATASRRPPARLVTERLTDITAPRSSQARLVTERLTKLPYKQSTPARLVTERLPEVPTTRRPSVSRVTERFPEISAARSSPARFVTARFPEMPATRRPPASPVTERFSRKLSTQINPAGLITERFTTNAVTQRHPKKLFTGKFPKRPVTRRRFTTRPPKRPAYVQSTSSYMKNYVYVTTAADCFQAYLNKAPHGDKTCYQEIIFAECVAREQGYFHKTVTDSDIHEFEYYIRRNFNLSESRCEFNLKSVISSVSFEQRISMIDFTRNRYRTVPFKRTTKGYADMALHDSATTLQVTGRYPIGTITRRPPTTLMPERPQKKHTTAAPKKPAARRPPARRTTVKHAKRPKLKPSTSSPAKPCLNIPYVLCGNATDGNYAICYPDCQHGTYLQCIMGRTIVRYCPKMTRKVRGRSHEVVKVFDPVDGKCKLRTPSCPRQL